MILRISAVFFAAGFFIVSRIQTIGLLYFSYGVLCGSASGLAYNSIMNSVPRWFPDRPGLISGLLLMGFGASSMVIGALFSAVTPAVAGAWRSSLLGIGLLMAVLLFAASFALRIPAQDEIPAAFLENTEKEGPGINYSPKDMLRHIGFWLLFIWAILLSGIGLIIISQARNLVLSVSYGLTAGAISLLVGIISVCNGLGRVIFGALYDKTGQRITMLAVGFASLVGVALIAFSLSGSSVLLAFGFICIGFGYGGTPTMNAAVIKQFYGNEHYPINFSLMNTNLLPASFLSPLGAAMIENSGSFSGVLLMLAAFGTAGLIVSIFIKQPK